MANSNDRIKGKDRNAGQQADDRNRDAKRRGNAQQDQQASPRGQQNQPQNHERKPQQRG